MCLRSLAERCVAVASPRVACRQLRAKFGSLPNKKAVMQRHLQGGGTQGRKYAAAQICLQASWQQLTLACRAARRYFDSADWAKDIQAAPAGPSDPKAAAASAVDETGQSEPAAADEAAERPPPIR